MTDLYSVLLVALLYNKVAQTFKHGKTDLQDATETDDTTDKIAAVENKMQVSQWKNLLIVLVYRRGQ